MARPSEPDADLDDALRLLHFAFRTVTARADAALAKRGYGRTHHRILYFIRREPGQSVATLLATLGVTKQSLHAPLQQLVRAGLVAKTRSVENGRVKELALTPRGRTLEASLSGPQRSLFASAFAGAPAASVAGWRAVMVALGGKQLRLATRRNRGRRSGRVSDS